MFDRVIRDLRHLALALLVAGAVAPGQTAAGPPYLSDDPEPTDFGHWETYNFAIGAGGIGGVAGEAGFDINYGAADDIQLTAVLPLAFDNTRGFSVNGLRSGPGDAELAVKYRFLHQADDTWMPDAVFFPRLFVPTADRQFGSGKFGLLLPIWVEKDSGPWSVFGGGGYQINPGAGQRSFWQGGIAISLNIGKCVSLGAEVYGQTRDADDGGAYETVNFAATYKLMQHWSLLASAGPAWSSKRTDSYVFYLALKADY